MSNSRIIAHEFDYFSPKTLKEASLLLKQHGPEAKIIAGGTDVLVQLKQEKISPACLIRIMGIPELRGIREDGVLKIGATATLREVREHARGSGHTALFEAISVLAKPQVWNMGTLAGNICNGSPAADTAPPLLVFGARVKVLGPGGERVLDLEDFFQGVNKTAMTPEEILVEIQVGAIEKGMGSAFEKNARVGADISKVTCAVSLTREGEQCTACRIALGAVAPTPMRAKEAEGMVQGRKVDATLVQKATLQVSREVQPIDDVRSTAAYRRQVAGVLFKDVFWTAWRRAGGEEK